MFTCEINSSISLVIHFLANSAFNYLNVINTSIFLLKKNLFEIGVTHTKNP